MKPPETSQRSLIPKAKPHVSPAALGEPQMWQKQNGFPRQLCFRCGSGRRCVSVVQQCIIHVYVTTITNLINLLDEMCIKLSSPSVCGMRALGFVSWLQLCTNKETDCRDLPCTVNIHVCIVPPRMETCRQRLNTINTGTLYVELHVFAHCRPGGAKLCSYVRSLLCK